MASRSSPTAMRPAFWRKADRRAVRVHQRRADAGGARVVRLRLVGRLGDGGEVQPARPRGRRPRARRPTAAPSTTSPTATGRRSTSSAPSSSSWSSSRHIRTHFVSPWIPGGLSRAEGRVTQATIAPCHGWVHVRVLNDRLHLHLFQRSGDVPIGVPSNMIQYTALMLMLEVADRLRGRRLLPHDLRRPHLREPGREGPRPARAARRSRSATSGSPTRAGRSPTSTTSGPSTSS